MASHIPVQPCSPRPLTDPREAPFPPYRGNCIREIKTGSERCLWGSWSRTAQPRDPRFLDACRGTFLSWAGTVREPVIGSKAYSARTPLLEALRRGELIYRTETRQLPLQESRIEPPLDVTLTRLSPPPLILDDPS